MPRTLLALRQPRDAGGEEGGTKKLIYANTNPLYPILLGMQTKGTQRT